MTTKRIYVQTPINAGAQIILDREVAHRLLRVLRLRVGEQVILFDGIAAGEFIATLLAASNDHATLIVEKFILVNRESPLKVHLGQGIARGEKMDFIIQKGTELGVTQISPIFTKYCNVQIKNERLEGKHRHWSSIAVSAAEQSGRCLAPQVVSAMSLQNWLSVCDKENYDLRIVLHPHSETKVSDFFRDFREEKPKSILFLVGSEGGLSEEEIVLITRHNFVPIMLGPRVLRTETAALVMLSILQAHFGDLY